MSYYTGIFAGFSESATNPGMASLFLPCETGTGFCPGQQVRYPPDMVSWGQNQPEPEVAVPVVRRVPVPVRRAAVPSVVVPTAAPFDTVRASGQNPKAVNYVPAESFAVRSFCKFDQRSDMTD